MLRHKKSFLCVEKGQTKALGYFEVAMCGRCRKGIIYYEGKQNE
jgi:hypothetical protein